MGNGATLPHAGKIPFDSIAPRAAELLRRP